MRNSRLLGKHFNYSDVGTTKEPASPARDARRGRVAEESVRVGSGQARWDLAWAQTLTWGIHRHSGYTIIPVEDSQGSPTAGIRPGLTVLLRRRFGPLVMAMPVRVVYVIDEPRRKGFAFGTLSGHPVSGEVAFIVEHHADDSVHFTLRSFNGPGKGLRSWYIPSSCCSEAVCATPTCRPSPAPWISASAILPHRVWVKQRGLPGADAPGRPQVKVKATSARRVCR